MAEDIYYSPEEIAWKLLEDDEDNYSSDTLKCLQMCTDIQDTYDNPATFLFEILLTIFMEMLVNLIKIDGSEMLVNLMKIDSSDGIGNEILISNDFQKYKNVLEYVVYKINKTNYYSLHVDFVEENEENSVHIKYLMENRYCKVLLRSDKANESFFELLRYQSGYDKDYHMTLNPEFKNMKKLNEIFAIIKLNNIIMKIKFTIPREI